ncbi:MAG: hypothetical protein LBC85_11450 [Fibromonadaceae bacterium]|jgi:hypothetical protein|nr:hypothetical protein [Fibromonadaceae bacterium]
MLYFFLGIRDKIEKNIFKTKYAPLSPLRFHHAHYRYPLHHCREIGGTAAESCQATPIIQPPQYGRDLSHPSPLHYNLKGTPLGTAKPTATGVYIEKHGKHTRKILIKH